MGEVEREQRADYRAAENVAHSWTTEDGHEFFVTHSGHIYERGDMPEDNQWEAGPEIGIEILRLKGVNPK